jgi:hypothetical protein
MDDPRQLAEADAAAFQSVIRLPSGRIAPVFCT